ncbi:MAG: hypothetical protein AAFQ80_11195 [Cyanobacteria bacterium J06621_8]
MVTEFLAAKFSSPAMRSPLSTSQIKTILLICLVSFTTLLIRQTLEIQHSCQPMIHWSGELSAECQIAVNNDNFNILTTPIQPKLKKAPPESKEVQHSSVSQSGQHTLEALQQNVEAKATISLEVAKEHPLETTIAAVSVVAGVSIALASAPIVGAAVAIAGVGSAMYSIFH